MQIMTKNITFFIKLICYHRLIVKLDHFMTLSLSYANTVLWCSHCKIHRFVAAPWNMFLQFKCCVVFLVDPRSRSRQCCCGCCCCCAGSCCCWRRWRRWRRWWSGAARRCGWRWARWAAQSRWAAARGRSHPLHPKFKLEFIPPAIRVLTSRCWPEMVFLNFWGAQKSIPRNRSASLCSLAGRYDNP